jgi:ABC-2 type transport system ATP-binding protein
MISAQALSRSFNGVPAVEELTFDIPEGKLFTLLGPNGAGKTTTVRLLLGLIGPSAGRATVAGFALGQGSAASSALRAVCGLLTEAPGFYERMSACDNLLFFARLYGLPESGLAERLERHLRLMSLWERRRDLVGTFSKGMKQKLALIRAIFHEPKVIFLDEPTAGLDPEAALMVRELILQLKSERRTIIVCTHNLDEAQRLSDIVGILKRRLLVCDTLARLQASDGRNGRVEIELREPSPEHARMIEALPFVSGVETLPGAYAVSLAHPRENIPRIVAALVAQGARILRVQSRQESLEEIYLRCVRDSG